MSPLSEARKRANKKWNDEHAAKRYERLNLNLPKGKPEQIKEQAHKQGLSTSAYINKLIDQDMQAEQERIAKLSPAKQWYRSEEGKNAVKNLTDKDMKKELP